jgi:4-hydroxy-3-polyprenylbenzoate decarboxylase
MDATRKWEYTPVALPKRHLMERAKEIWEELGFPKLQPREPWFGRNLGMWPDQYVRQAELAEKGEFDRVAQELMKERKKI